MSIPPIQSALVRVGSLPVSIIGNGVGAFTSALSLHRAGIRNNIFLAGSNLSQTARQAIFLGGSAVRILDRLGLGSDYRLLGSSIHHLDVCDYTGRSIITSKLDGLGAQVWVVPKDQLLQLFLESVPPDSVHFDCKLRSMRFTPTSGVDLDFSQMRNYVGKLQIPLQHTVNTRFVIGADGVASTVRMFMSRDVMTMPSGVTVWRAFVRHLNLDEIPFHVAREFWHGEKRFGYVRVTYDQVMWWALISTGVQQVHSAILRPFTPHLHRMFDDVFPPLVPKLINAVDSDRHIERQELRRIWPQHSPWVDRTSWRVALVGDARRPASAETHHMSHSFAVDDGYILANILVEAYNNSNNFKNKNLSINNNTNTNNNNISTNNPDNNNNCNSSDDDHPLDMYDENRQRNLQITRDLAKQAQRLANAKSFPRRYVVKTLLNRAIEIMTSESMSSIISPSLHIDSKLPSSNSTT